MEVDSQSPGQVIEMNLTGFGVCSQCGTELEEGTRISYWHSRVGKGHDRIIACPACRRPTALLKERGWLMGQLNLLESSRAQFGVGSATMTHAELANSIAYIRSELESNWQKVNTVMLRLLSKLPKCEECPEYASHQIKNGPFLCDVHSSGHPTALRVDWAMELSELGVGNLLK